MDLSLFLAQFLGVYLLIVAVICAFRKKHLHTAAKEIISCPGSLAISGAIQLMLGLSIAIAHPIWELNWQGLITLIGYFLIVQGILRLAFPNQTKKCLLKYLDKKCHYSCVVVLAVIALVLIYNGFAHYHHYLNM